MGVPGVLLAFLFGENPLSRGEYRDAEDYGLLLALNKNERALQKEQSSVPDSPYAFPEQCLPAYKTYQTVSFSLMAFCLPSIP